MQNKSISEYSSNVCGIQKPISQLCIGGFSFHVQYSPNMDIYIYSGPT